MAVRSLNRQSGTTGLRATTAHSIDIVSDSAAGDRLKLKDSGGTVRELVDTSSTQTLTGKTAGFLDPVASAAGDGAITITPGTVKITKGSAAALTLAAPTAAQEGTFLTITSQTAFAHVVTATSLLGDGVSGSPHTTATFAAFIGATITLEAINLIWNVVSLKGVTVT
jgi:hypothetical protein